MAAPLAPVVRQVRGAGGEWGAAGVVELDHPADEVYRFMRQVEEQPRWNAGVKLSEVVRRVSATTTHVKQVLAWSFLAIRGDFDLQLEMREEPAKRMISTQLLHGSPMMRQFSSKVGVQRTGPRSCTLEMEMFMSPGMYVPWGVRHMVGGQVKRQLHGVLAKVKDTLDSESPQQRHARLAAAASGGGVGSAPGWLFGGAGSSPGAVLQQLLARPLLEPIAVW